MPAELDQLSPEMGDQMNSPDHVIGTHGDEVDREGEMAKIDLEKAASYAHKLSQELQDNTQLEAWVQKKISVAAENLASVYHYMAYEMKINEMAKTLKQAGVITEGKNLDVVRKLIEAKEKIKDLKKAQAEKIKAKKEQKMDESFMEPCGHCGGAGHVEKKIPEEVKGKVEKYNKLTKAMKAAHKRLDKNHNGIPDDQEMEENFDGERGGDQDTPSKFNVQKTGPNSTRYTRKSKTFSDEHDGGDGKKSHAKSKSAAEKKAEAPHQKKSKTGTWGMENGEKFDNRKKEESFAEGAKPDFLDLDKDGNKKESMKKAAADKKKGAKKVDEAKMTPAQLAHHHATEYAKHHKTGNLELASHHKDECEACGGTIKHGAMGECYHSHPHINNGTMYECPGNMATTIAEAKPSAGQRSQDSAIKVAQIGKSKSPGANLKQGAEDALEKGNHKKIDQIHQYATTTTPTGRAKKVSEAKPSAGLSAAKKSATVKKAKAGGDIGKPGKSFDKVAKSAGGGEKGKKIAAAAMWKNIKETTAYIEEKKAVEKKADKDYDGDGKIESGKDEYMGSKDKAIKAAMGKKETVKESTDFARMQEQLARLNRSETQTLKESSEADQIRALTQKLLG